MDRVPHPTEGPHGAPQAHPEPEHPDPSFWGPEPRSVRRPGRRARTRVPEPGIGARVDAWRARVLGSRVELGVGAVAVVIVALVAGVVWYRMGVAGGDTPPPAGPGGPPSAGGPPAADRERGAAPGSEAPDPTRLADAEHGRGPTVVVHVAGAVRTPGVLVLPAGARVIDAVDGAGGALPEADLDRVNLAAKLIDGQRIVVAMIGAPSAPDGTPAPVAAGEPTLIDLNTATIAELETLPGIGPALAGAIVAERERRGGFRSINELREVRGIGERRFAELRDRVTV